MKNQREQDEIQFPFSLQENRKGRSIVAKEYAKKFYNSAAWRKCRETYIKIRIDRDGGICEECHGEQGYIVHHRIRITKQNIDDANIVLNHNNLMYVCKSCHDRYEGHGAGGHGKAQTVCRFNEMGEPISMREIDRSRGSEGSPPFVDKEKCAADRHPTLTQHARAHIGGVVYGQKTGESS